MGNGMALAYVLAHPMRQRIVSLLREGNALSLREIVNQSGSSEDLIGFHLVALEQHGLVARSMEFANPEPRVEAKFRQTEKVKEAIKAMRVLA